MEDNWITISKTGSGRRSAVAVGCDGLALAYLGLFFRLPGPVAGRPGAARACLEATACYEPGRRRSPVSVVEKLGGWLAVDAAEDWAQVVIGVPGSCVMDGYGAVRDIVRNSKRCCVSIQNSGISDDIGRAARCLLWSVADGGTVDCQSLWRDISSEHVVAVGVSSYDPESVAEDMLAAVSGLGKSIKPGAVAPAAGSSPGYWGEVAGTGRDRLAIAFNLAIDTPRLFAAWLVVAKLLAGGRSIGVINQAMADQTAAIRTSVIPGRLGSLVVEIDCLPGQSPLVLERLLRQMESLAKTSVVESDLRTARAAAVTWLKMMEDDPRRQCELIGMSRMLYGQVITARWVEAVGAEMDSELLTRSVGQLLSGGRALVARVNRDHAVSLSLLESIWATEIRV